MNHFIDMKAKTPVELSSAYQLLHKRLYDMHSDDIGVSFPTGLSVLRVHGSAERLEALMTNKFIDRLASKVCCSFVKHIPDNVVPVNVFRKRQRKSMSRLRRHQQRGATYTEEQINDYRLNMCKESLSCLYISMDSTSTQQHYLLFIDTQEADQEQQGKFNHFGLSKTATVPMF